MYFPYPKCYCCANSSSTALRPIFGPFPSCCRGFETTEFYEVRISVPNPNPNLQGQDISLRTAFLQMGGLTNSQPAAGKAVVFTNIDQHPHHHKYLFDKSEMYTDREHVGSNNGTFDVFFGSSRFESPSPP